MLKRYILSESGAVGAEYAILLGLLGAGVAAGAYALSDAIFTAFEMIGSWF